MYEDSDNDDNDDDNVESVAAAMGANSSSMTGRVAASVAAALGIIRYGSHCRTGARNVAQRSVSSYGIGVGLGTRTAPTDVMKCLHYEGRKCNIVAPCCGEIFGCRVCHDEMVTDGHEMNRFLVREIVCKDCHTRQERS